MDVLQKWNRSIPDGWKWDAAAAVLFLLFIFLKQFYLFPSGGWRHGGCMSVRLLFMLLCDCMRRRPNVFSAENRRTVLCVYGICFGD